MVARPEPSSTSQTPPAQPPYTNLNGLVVDLDTLQPVKQANVSITDVFGRSLEVPATDAGIFRFENVPPGTATIVASAPGYLQSVTALDIGTVPEVYRRFPLRSKARARP